MYNLYKYIYIYIYKVGNRSQGKPEGFLFNSYYTEVLGRIQLLSLDCSTLPSIRTLYCWVLSKEVSSIIFKVFGITQPGIEPRSPGPLGNTLPTRPIFGLMSREFANGLGDQVSIPGWVIPKTQKMVLDSTFFSTQHYKVRIKGKVEQSQEWSSPPTTPCCSSYWKGAFGSPLTTVTNYYIYKYIYIYIYICVCVCVCTHTCITCQSPGRKAWGLPYIDMHETNGCR